MKKPVGAERGDNLELRPGAITTKKQEYQELPSLMRLNPPSLKLKGVVVRSLSAAVIAEVEPALPLLPPILPVLEAQSLVNLGAQSTRDNSISQILKLHVQGYGHCRRGSKRQRSTTESKEAPCPLSFSLPNTEDEEV